MPLISSVHPFYFESKMNEWIEDKRDTFLCAIYDGHLGLAETTFKDIRNTAVTVGCLTEYHQKILAQSLVIFKRFRGRLTSGCSKEILTAAHDIKRRLSSLARANRSFAPRHIDYTDFRTLLDIPRSCLNTLYQTVITFQLTSGCSHFCRRCNEWALPGVRGHFSFDAVKQILQELTAAGNSDYSLYGASDPLDWQDGNFDMRHIMEFLSENRIHLEFGLLTKIPKGKEALLLELVHRGTNMAVSVTARNRDRFEKIEKNLPAIDKQHDFDDLLIPACLDEDFSTVKSSITDTYGTEISPDGVFIIIPTFTSALNPFGHKKIPVTGETSFFLLKRNGRQALRVDYFKPLEAVTLGGDIFRLGELLDTQIETLLLDNGSNDLNVPGMTNIREYFDTFKPKAMHQRKKMLPSVMRKLKTTKKALPEYLELVQGYSDFCKPGPVIQSKLHAVSFFLNSIRSYIKSNPVRAKLIFHLRKSYIADLDQTFLNYSDQTDITTLFTKPSLDSFLLFEFIKFKTLISPDAQNITAFIQKNRACFDHISDRFVPVKPC